MLPPNDLECLAERAPGHQVSIEGGMVCVLIPDFPLGEGFDQKVSDLLLRLATGYPDVAPDMWWFHPPVRRADGQTIGGDVDACEKLIHLIHSKLTDGQFRVIIPDVAKSAGTIMALGANQILMSDTSELGMIDPQFPMKDNQGNEFWHSVIAYLEAYEEHSTALRNNPKDSVALLALDHFDAKVVRKFQGMRDRVRTFAEDLHGLPSSTISDELLSSARWKTHGQPIRHGDAAQLGLPVIYIPGNDPRWARYWKLYCLQRLAIPQAGKSFDQPDVSQVVEE